MCLRETPCHLGLVSGISFFVPFFTLIPNTVCIFSFTREPHCLLASNMPGKTLPLYIRLMKLSAEISPVWNSKDT